jgi:hypothetical protein
MPQPTTKRLDVGLDNARNKQPEDQLEQAPAKLSQLTAKDSECS